ncbi:MAG: PHP domain-containing protein [Deltaproteobacteria bacterium]|nr:PHP domain-containing protein [Deltaproteobacteria bacterium]
MNNRKQDKSVRAISKEMKIDLHIHSRCSDGQMDLREIFEEARKREIGLISITDHDSLDCQEEAEILAAEYGIQYIYGLELSVSFSHPGYRESKPVSLDFLAYEYDIHYPPLNRKLTELREYRQNRAEQILEKINRELAREDLQEFTHKDLEEIRDSMDGAFGRPHIADHMVKKGVVASRQEAFDRYLVRCNVPKMPLTLTEASKLVKGAGGRLMLSHPNHPRGTSLIKLTRDLKEQQKIVEETMLSYIDGIECWHSEHDRETTESYLAFARRLGLMVTGGSDCHQQPVILGTVNIPYYVAEQFSIDIKGE